MNEFLFVRTGKIYTRIFFAEIIYIESLNNHVRIVTRQNQRLVKVTLSQVEKVLPENQFCRIHQSYIVSLRSISGFNHDNVQIQGKDLSIGESYRKILFDRIITQPVKPEVAHAAISKFGLN
jgi:DNA-binding LytR/AlgR family response regulator